MVTETRTETASTETLLFTETTTATAGTQTITIAQTATVDVTVTNVQTAATVTTTAWTYEALSSLKARFTALSVPTYASAACSDWEQYVQACKCAGVTDSTSTLPAVTETVTVSAGDAATSVGSTVAITTTETVSVTATTLATEIATITPTETISTTEIATLSATVVVSQTTTATVVVPQWCQPTGVVFRASTPFSDGSTRYLDVLEFSSKTPDCAWQAFPGTPFGDPDAYASMWRLDAGGYLELAQVLDSQTSILVPYISLSDTAASVELTTKAKSDVLAGVEAGTYARVQGCIDPATKKVSLSGAGRSNLLACGNGAYLSSGSGSDTPYGKVYSCDIISPTAEFS